MRDSLKLVLSIAAIILVLVSGGIILYNLGTKADPLAEESSVMNSYDVTWTIKENRLSNVSDFVSKNTEYKKTISFKTPNLKDITVRLQWIDDNAPFFGFFGRDTLTLTVITPAGDAFRQSAQCTRRTKQGFIEITIPVKTNLPASQVISSPTLLSAGEQLRETSFDYTWVNEEFTIQVFDQIGEIRPLKRMHDHGNDFELEITSEYYHATFIVNSGVKETNIPDDTYTTTSMIPPSVCPFCDGVFQHEPWCPYYEDPFEDDFFEDHSYDFSSPDPWNNHYHSYAPIPVDNPWQIFFAYLLFLLMVFFGKIWVFGGIF
jgi:hypothetical protein